MWILQNLSKIELDDIPKDHMDLAEHLGLDSYLELARLCGGQCLYIPKLDTLWMGARDREIRERFNGRNYKALGQMFGLSERQVRKIVNGTRV